jgi:N-glycosylase/DNA lyase
VECAWKNFGSISILRNNSTIHGISEMIFASVRPIDAEWIDCDAVLFLSHRPNNISFGNGWPITFLGVDMPMFYYLKDDKIQQREVPSPEASVLPNIPWGRPDALFTPAYWMTQYWMREGDLPQRSHAIGQTLEEEVVACLLGGHGIPAEVGIAAFERLRSRGLISTPNLNADTLSTNLREPLTVAGRQVIYRFWAQKARYLAAALRTLNAESVPRESPRELRLYLMRLPGVGPKTASWIVRNWLNSNEVAILDIHIVRAGQLMNLYSLTERVDTHYFAMEQRFLDLASAIGIPASDLDALIWSEMRRTPRLVARVLASSDERQKHLT